MRVLLDTRVELLVLNVNSAMTKFSNLVRVAAKCCPSSRLVLVIGHWFDLIGGSVPGAVGIDHEQKLAVVSLAMNERYKQAALLAAQEILKDPSTNIGV